MSLIAKFNAEKFNGSNYFGLRRVKMRCLLIQHGSEAALDPIPGTMTDADKTTALKTDVYNKAHSALLLFLDNKVLREANKKDSAAGVWLKMETLYMTKSLANKLCLKKKLFTFYMHSGKKLSEHIDEFNKLIGELANIDVDIDDEDQALMLLTSLPSSYDNFVKTLLYGRESLTLEDVLSSLNSRELKKRIDVKDDGEGSPEEGLSKKEQEEINWLCQEECEIGFCGSFHMTPNMDFLFDFKEFNGGTVLHGDNRVCAIKGTGKVRVQMKDGSSFVLKNVRDQGFFDCFVRNYERTKHINVRYHFITEIVESKEIEVAKIGTEDNAADAFTKVVPGMVFEFDCLLYTAKFIIGQSYPIYFSFGLPLTGEHSGITSRLKCSTANVDLTSCRELLLHKHLLLFLNHAWEAYNSFSALEAKRIPELKRGTDAVGNVYSDGEDLLRSDVTCDDSPKVSISSPLASPSTTINMPRGLYSIDVAATFEVPLTTVGDLYKLINDIKAGKHDELLSGMINDDHIETLDALDDSINHNVDESTIPSDPIVQSVDINTKSTSYAGAAGASAKDQPKVNSNFRTLVANPVFDGVNIYISRKVVKKVSTRFEHTLYGYFIGKRMAFPVVEYYARNNWVKHGLKRIMMNSKGFFFFKFDSQAGLEAVLEGGPWLIRKSPIILKKWSMDTRLFKEELTRILHMATMCNESWGRSSFCRCLIEVNSEANLVDVVLLGTNNGFPNNAVKKKKRKGKSKSTNGGQFVVFGTDISQKDEKPSKKRQNRTRDGKEIVAKMNTDLAQERRDNLRSRLEWEVAKTETNRAQIDRRKKLVESDKATIHEQHITEIENLTHIKETVADIDTSDGVFSVASIRKEIDGNRFQDVSLPTRWVKSVPIKNGEFGLVSNSDSNPNSRLLEVYTWFVVYIGTISQQASVDKKIL
ncbi:zinc knuckle CX2CX4HX4C containing protein [Tanacetum coccineum]